MANNPTPQIGGSEFQDSGSSSTSNGALSKGASAKGDGIVWASTQVTFGPFATPITTRGLKDAAVIGVAIILGIAGIMLISEPDISKIAGKLKAFPIPV